MTTLTNPTSKQLRETIALRVLGAQAVEDCTMRLPDVTYDGQSFEHWKEIPPFDTSADAVLPLLEKHVALCNHMCGLWEVIIHRGYRGNAKTPFAERLDYTYRDKNLPIAACVALLKAHGVGVVFTDTKS